MTGMPPYQMTRPCRFCLAEGESVMDGIFKTVNGQDTVRCIRCGKLNYNASRAETGKPQRKVKSREDLADGQRERILERDGARCLLCGRDPQTHNVNLHISHAVSLAEGRQQGCTDEQLNDDSNLFVSCEECNLGWSSRSLEPWIMARLLLARINRKKSGGIL